ncbi:MAG: hypothetical protein AB1730_28310 [Myxococcota bacterium]
MNAGARLTATCTSSSKGTFQGGSGTGVRCSNSAECALACTGMSCAILYNDSASFTCTGAACGITCRAGHATTCPDGRLVCGTS